MKALPIALLLALPACVYGQTVPASTSPPKAEIVQLPASEQYLSEHLLDRFNEPRLDNGSPDGKPVIRITVLRGNQSPVMMIWHPERRDGTSTLHVKVLKVDTIQATTSYTSITLDRLITLTQAQTKALKSIYTLAPLQSLPKEPWQSETLDGSAWVYEAAAGKRSVMVCRRNPISPDLSTNEIPKARLVKELQLTSFGLTLWTMANIDEMPK